MNSSSGKFSNNESHKSRHSVPNTSKKNSFNLGSIPPGISLIRKNSIG